VALCTVADVQALVAGDGISTPVVDSALLTSCIAVAGELIVEETARIWEKATSLTEYFDGDSADGKCLDILKPRRFPLYYAPPGDPITVTENGIALVVAQGYTTSADVIVKGVGLEFKGSLIRRNQSWAAGRQNIVAIYNAGFTAVPGRINFVARELSWLCYQQGRKIGVDQVSESGSSRHLITQLSKASQRILELARRAA